MLFIVGKKYSIINIDIIQLITKVYLRKIAISARDLDCTMLNFGIQNALYFLQLN